MTDEMISESVPANKKRNAPLVETIAVFAGTMAVFKALHLAGAPGRAVLGYLVPIGFVYVPLLVLHFTRRDFAAYGLSLAGWGRGVRVALVAALVFLPLYVVGVHLLPQIVVGRAISFHWSTAIAGQAALQLLVVACPEEIFFRGYMQTRLADRFPRRRRILGADVPVAALLATSVLFALGHVVIQTHPARLLVFFPSLVFGWMRERTGSLVAPTLFHGLANITVLILFG